MNSTALMKNSFNFLRLSEPDKIHAGFKVKFLNKSSMIHIAHPRNNVQLTTKIKVLNRAFKVRLIKIIKIM